MLQTCLAFMRHKYSGWPGTSHTYIDAQQTGCLTRRLYIVQKGLSTVLMPL